MFSRLYIKEEHIAKKGKELDSAKWTIGSLKACVSKPINVQTCFPVTVTLMTSVLFEQELPQQKNGSDCGVFVCKYADFIAKEKSFTFKQVPAFSTYRI